MINYFFRKFLSNDKLRNYYCFFRAFILCKIFNKMKTVNNTSEHTWKNTLESNQRAVHNKNISLPKHPNAKRILDIGKSLSGAKARDLFKIINMKYNQKDFSRLKILSIGPRSEGEIYLVYSFGFEMKNIFAIDLFSYSSLVSLGDMHKLNFQDNYFDIIIMGWCLAYSNNKVVALNEAKRVLKQDGLIAIGHTFAKKSDKEMISERGYIVGSPNQKISNEKELDLLIYNSGLKKFNSILLNGENKIAYGATK